VQSQAGTEAALGTGEETALAGLTGGE